MDQRAVIGGNLKDLDVKGWKTGCMVEKMDMEVRG